MKITFPNNLIALILISLVFILSSCRNFDDDGKTDTLTMEKLIIADDFNYEISDAISIKIYAKNNQDNPIPNVKFSLYTDDPENEGLFILSGVTDESGQFFLDYEIPSYFTELTITTNYIGLKNMAIVPVTNEGIVHTFGETAKSSSKSNDIMKNVNFNFAYLGTYNSYGTPNYLEDVNDVIDSDLLDDINNTLPEYVQLPIEHPQYFEDGLRHNISLLDPLMFM